MKAEEEAFVPEALFLLMPADNGKFVLKAQNDRFVKAEPSGHLSAVTVAWDDWEEFDVVKHDGGKVSLRSFHNKYIRRERWICSRQCGICHNVGTCEPEPTRWIR